MRVEHVDVLIVGAGLSGIDAGYRLQTQCPDLGYAILESRDAIGGTWDLFRYPGIRSDSDMYTLGFPFRPWRGEKSIADGPDILQYIRDTAAEFGIDRRIRFGHRVIDASWSSEDARWTVRASTGQGTVEMSCSFLYLCSGYYSYESGYLPDIPGLQDFAGTVVHPQFWPENLDYEGKRIVVIGSGATAVTLVPALAEKAEHVTMLQRSPTYVMSLPARDPIATRIRRLLPDRVAHRAVRTKNVVANLGFYQFCQRFPSAAKRMLRTLTERRLRGRIPVDPHFSPRYDPWDQRLCVVPDSDLFRTLRAGEAEIVTDRIDTVTEKSVRLESGRELEAEILIPATGLQLVPAGGIEFVVDGEKIELSARFIYRGMMLDGLPNAAMCLGYTNASWTLRADLASLYVCRLLRYMRRNGYRSAVPRYSGDGRTRPLLGLDAGYIHRAEGALPKQGARSPWLMRQNYLLDLPTMRLGRVDESMQFTP
ncbi:NAD(P)/FAD-dependent oxidoreductase [Rhodococcus pyridinivorans]|uniref:flavin-containing monooxygenase n=1 Tax=Rhodococcus pyridinivorans TaxID=103816 RepID=UPI0020C5C8DA|nr:NAD(P)/FAD-dependent oxidoreductase [Rhodococcus pyridinivorans]UTM37241.1 NAD(P)/FAD-dependent oxidoreductase [Rhodococcus pyridinivorans]